MNTWFTYAEGSILIRLLIAHFISDFFLQPDKWVKEKRLHVWQSPYLYLHILVTAAFVFLFLLNDLQLIPVLFIVGTHLVIDGVKLQVEKIFIRRNIDFFLFLVDQLLHVAVIIISWLWMIKGYERFGNLLQFIASNYNIWLIVCGYVFITSPVGYIIHFATRHWTEELSDNDSLQHAGKWIGIIERVLILTMVFINQFAAIGFLVAAKSILRVIDKPEKPLTVPVVKIPFSSRKHTEYVLMGTFLSVGAAIFTGLFISYLLG